VAAGSALQAIAATFHCMHTLLCLGFDALCQSCCTIRYSTCKPHYSTTGPGYSPCCTHLAPHGGPIGLGEGEPGA
jgi:hypothetical protein